MSDKTPLTIGNESMKRVDLVTVEGRIDSTNASVLDDELKEIMGNGRHNIVLNLNKVSYMSSAGLRVLVGTLRECKGKRGDVRIAEPSERVNEVLELAGLTSLFSVYESATEAVGSF
jgi:anti-sigma B factor antagonist